MSLHAFDDISDALDATRAFLFPFDRTKWLKLAVIVFFVGGLGAQFPSGFNYGGGSGDFDGGGSPVGELPPWVAENVWLIVGGILAAFVLFVLLMMLISSVMQFVFLEALRGDEVHVRAPFREHFGKGLRLFGFQVVVVAAILAPVAAFGAWLADGALNGTIDPGTVLAVLFLGLPFYLVYAFVLGLTSNFTNTFVAPVMLLESRGVIAGWRRFWTTLRREWKEYLAYLVMSWVLGFIAAIALGIAVALAVLVLLIPFGLVGAATVVGALALGQSTAAAIVWWVFAFEVLLFGLAALVATALIAVPVQTYLRYYSLLVLGDTEEAFDVIPERRAAVREDAGDATPA